MQEGDNQWPPLSPFCPGNWPLASLTHLVLLDHN